MKGVLSDDFLLLTQKLLSADNDVRKAAEEEYDKLENEPKVLFLLGTFEEKSCPAEVRSLSAVLLRRFFSNHYDEFVEKLANERSLAQVKELLLRLVQAEENDQLSRKISDVVAELARNIVCVQDENTPYPWPELLEFLFTCVSSEVTHNKLAALYIFVQFPGVLGQQQNHFLPEIKERLAFCIQDQQNPQSRFLAARAVIAFVLHNEGDKDVTKLFADLLPPLLMVVNETVGEDDAVLKGLIEVAESMPVFLKPHLEAVCQLCLQVSGNGELEESWRQLSFECITTLAESVPQLLRKHASKLMPEIIKRGLQFMTLIEDEDDWAFQDDNEDDLDSISVAGETGLDRIACGVGGRAFLQYITPMLSELLGSPDWKNRHAALMAISVIGEGCHSQMETLLPRIVPSITPYLEDEHPRVRYAACNAMGQMATDFHPTFQVKFHEAVVPRILSVLANPAFPRVQAHGAAALVNFSEDCPGPVLEVYLPQILEKLQVMIQTNMNQLHQPGARAVLEQSVTTLAAVADSSKDNFKHYYTHFMPSLKLMMQNATHKELRLLRGKTIECISLIGLAVGRDLFMQDAAEVMDMLLKAQVSQEEFEDDDPQVSYMMSAWARMCKILGQQFQQYMPVVMPPLMKVASVKPEVAFVDSEDLEKDDDEGWQYVNIGDNQNLGIRTAGLEDKSTACTMLVCYARELKEAFAPYVEQVLELMLPLLKFYFHDGVRTAAAECMPLLLECSSVRGVDAVGKIWREVADKLLEAIKAEPEPEIQCEQIAAYAQCIVLLGNNCLDDVMMGATVEVIEQLFSQHFERQNERKQKRLDEDYDEGVEEMLQDEVDGDVYVLSKIADLVHSLFTAYGPSFLPVWDKLVPTVMSLFAPDHPATDRQWGLCMWDDVIELGGPGSWGYSGLFLESMLKYTIDNDPQVRQAASYGVGVMATHGGPQYTQACLSGMPLLKQAISLAEARSTREHTMATENAISAIGKILRALQASGTPPPGMDLSAEIAQWFTWLPVFEDKEEAVATFDYLCQLIESNEVAILGADNANVPRILEVMADGLAVDALSDSAEVEKRCAAIIAQIKQSEVMWNAGVANLAEAQRHALLNTLNNAEASAAAGDQ